MRLRLQRLSKIMRSVAVMCALVAAIAHVDAVPDSCVLDEYYATLQSDYGSLSWTGEAHTHLQAILAPKCMYLHKILRL